MLQQYIRYFTDKVIEALNVGSVEMVNLHQNLLTPDFILIGLLEQEGSMISKLIETSYPENKNLSIQILEKIFADQENQAKFKGNTIQQIQLSAET
ncbi:MAG TPA: ATP-dependent Clp protease ATP-binding subunit, partial [Nitrospinaceae bacterium]|nr:ATP-dependent Clp protease ATP-binding subunit [Nitrospinaceae bacterium]